MPGARPPSSVEPQGRNAQGEGAQHIGEEAPWPADENALQSPQGTQHEQGDPVEHVTPIDARAFPRILHVLVKLSTLGIDETLWGDLQKFSGVVMCRYYHPVTRSPMYAVDFRGGIGHRIVRVSDTKLDIEKQFRCEGRGSGTTGVVEGSGSMSALQQTDIGRGETDNEDPEWQAGYENFNCSQGSGEGSFPDTTSLEEEPLQELGLYKYDEDVTGWSFERLFADD